MRLEFIALGKLSVSKANMRYAKKAPDVSDLLPTVRKRGVIQPLIVRPQACVRPDDGSVCDRFEIVGGARRFHAARIVAEETGITEPLPCAILDGGDDAAAIEASLIENFARLDPDEVTQWEAFTRLVREGRKAEDIAATFGLPDAMVRRILALGNLLPRIRDLYRREKIDAATVRHLTMASKNQQKAWIDLFDDPASHAPGGHNLKAWLFGGQSIRAGHALFDLDASGVATIADLFGDERYIADPDQFWTAQNAAIEERRVAYLTGGWSAVMVVPPSEHFHAWEYEKAAKRKGGRVHIDIRASGEVTFHEGYLTRAEARRLERGEAPVSSDKPARPEVTGPMQIYLDLHRHAAVRAAMTGHPALALRLMVAHAIAGSPLWAVRTEPQMSRSDAVRESVENCRGEAQFDEKRRAVLTLLGLDADSPTLCGANSGDHGTVHLFLRLVALTDPEVLNVVAIVMGETLAAGSPAVEAVGSHLAIDMATYWQSDDAFFELLRDREVLTALVGEVAGKTVADANAGERGKVLKQILRDHLAGAGGRAKVEGWVPRWMAFPPGTYTARGGVGSVSAAAALEAARQGHEAAGGVMAPPDHGPDEREPFAA